MADTRSTTRPHLQRVEKRAARNEQPSPALRRDMRRAAPDVLNRILTVLRSGTGHDFFQYKKMAIGRSIERRMMQLEIEDAAIYAHYLEAHPAEVQRLLNDLLINVTRFFRDPEAFATLKQDILPQLFADKPKRSVFRVWVAGCASGEESYSIAMLLRELMDETGQELKVQLYSTDLDQDAIAVARAGTYPPDIVHHVEPARLQRFFVKGKTGYRVKKEIRDMAAFSVRNVITDAPFKRLDLVSCRNLMIYLEPQVQRRLISTFQSALRPGGALFLSPSESIGTHSELFAPLCREWRIYRSTRAAAPAHSATTAPREKDDP